MVAADAVLPSGQPVPTLTQAAGVHPDREVQVIEPLTAGEPIYVEVGGAVAALVPSPFPQVSGARVWALGDVPCTKVVAWGGESSTVISFLCRTPDGAIAATSVHVPFMLGPPMVQHGFTLYVLENDRVDRYDLLHPVPG